MRSLLPLLLVATLYPDTALGQGPSSPLARADTAALIGSFSAKRADAAEYNQWTHSLAGSIAGGFYWSDHLKTEIEISSTSLAEAYGSEPAGLPESPPSSIFLEHAYRSFMVSAGQSYQFRRNALFHPFVGAGVDVERMRHQVERPAQSVPIYARNPLNPQIVSVTGHLSIPALTQTDTAVTVSPHVVAGFKAYFTERGFFRTDLKVSLQNGIERVTWRAGFGADF